MPAGPSPADEKKEVLEETPGEEEGLAEAPRVEEPGGQEGGSSASKEKEQEEGLAVTPRVEEGEEEEEAGDRAASPRSVERVDLEESDVEDDSNVESDYNSTPGYGSDEHDETNKRAGRAR